MSELQKIVKLKKKQILSLSAGGPGSGIQGIFFEYEHENWQILSQCSIPYPHNIQDPLFSLADPYKKSLSLDEFCLLDLRLTQIFLETARTTIAKAPGKGASPHFVLINSPSYRQRNTSKDNEGKHWNLSLVDPSLIASALGCPVISGMIRTNILSGGYGELSLGSGLIRMLHDHTGIHILLNIGLLAQIIIVDIGKKTVLWEDITGPGTVLIDLIAQKSGINKRFDRDGQEAAKGTVNNPILAELLQSDWFLHPTSKPAVLSDFTPILESVAVKKLSPDETLSTLTALTSKSIFNYYRKVYDLVDTPTTVWVSGGGAHNLTIFNFIKTLFDPIDVRSVEDLGILPDACIPLLLALSGITSMENEKRTDRIGSLGNFGSIIYP